MNPPRRRAITIGVAAVAAATGAGVAAWLGSRGGAPAPAGPPPAPVGGALDLWSTRFEQPGGGWLDMSERRGRPTLLNFWATWCPPCVEELPMLDAFHRDHTARGWQVIGLAIDNPGAVRQFLARHPVSFPIGLAGIDGVELGRALGNAAGALPFTVVFDTAGEIVDRKLGALKPADLQSWGARF